jgi:hypothetical protein
MRAEGFAGKEVMMPAAERSAVVHLKEAFGMSERRAKQINGSVVRSTME